jgi:hypothetical protein
MKNFESYAALPLEDLKVGRDKLLEFFNDRCNRLTQSVADGAAFDNLLPPYKAALTNLSNSKTATAVNLAQQGSETMTVDNYILQFKNDVTKLEPKVLVQFPKTSVEYHEFFPQGKNVYNQITKANIDNLFATIITACTNHADKLGNEPGTEFTALRDAYQAARNRQQQKKGSTGNTRSAWDDNLDIIKDLTFHNLLMIADAYRGQPGKIGVLFNQSIITPGKSVPVDETKDATPHNIPAV